MNNCGTRVAQLKSNSEVTVEELWHEEFQLSRVAERPREKQKKLELLKKVAQAVAGLLLCRWLKDAPLQVWEGVRATVAAVGITSRAKRFAIQEAVGAPAKKKTTGSNTNSTKTVL